MTVQFKNVALTNHCLARARQRIDLGCDVNSLEYQYKLEGLMRKAVLRDMNNKGYVFEFVYNQKTYQIFGNIKDNTLIASTIYPK